MVDCESLWEVAVGAGSPVFLAPAPRKASTHCTSFPFPFRLLFLAGSIPHFPALFFAGSFPALMPWFSLVLPWFIFSSTPRVNRSWPRCALLSCVQFWLRFRWSWARAPSMTYCSRAVFNLLGRNISYWLICCFYITSIKHALFHEQ